MRPQAASSPEPTASKLHGRLVIKDAGAWHTTELWICRLQSSDHQSLTMDLSKGHLTLFVSVWSPDKTPCVSLASASKIIMGKRSQPFQLGSFQDSTVGRGGEDHSRCYRKKRKPRRCSTSLPSPFADSTLKNIICYRCCETHCPGQGKSLGKEFIYVCQSVEFINLTIWKFYLDPVHILNN